MTTHSNERLRVAVVGVGALGRHHARILSQLSDVELVAVAESNREQGESVAASCGCEWTHDYRTLLSRIDAVSIVVPTFLHRSIAEDFLCRSIPVLVEKPLTADLQDGATLVRLAREHGVPLQVGHVERFNPAFQAVEQRIHRPKYIRGERISPYAFRSMDIGVVHDLMIHDIELTLQLVGQSPCRVEAFGVSLLGGHEDVVQARLYFPNGCIADLTANRVAPAAKRALQCWGEHGLISADLQTRTLTCFTPGEPLRRGELPFDLVMNRQATPNDLKPEVFGRFIMTETFQGSDADALTAELRSFVDCVRDGGPPAVSGEQGLAALRVADEVLKCVATHTWDGTPDGHIGPHALIESTTGRGYSSHSRAA